MAIREPKYTPEEHARLGKELYQKTVLPKVEIGNHGKIVAMDVDSGDFELGDTTFEAAERLLERHPGAQIWSERIGYPAVYRFGGRLLADAE